MKPISGFNNRYLISERGEVFVKRTDELLKLKTGLSNSGYLYVRLHLNNYTETAYVHRLVAKAFCENLENKTDVNHIDGNKLNNHYKNLVWVTKKENIQHAEKLNLMNHGLGENSVNNVLTQNQVIEIRNLKGKLSSKKIAKLYNVSVGTISKILTNKTWRWLA